MAQPQQGRPISSARAALAPHRATAGWAVAASVSLALLGWASGPILHVFQQAAGWKPTAPQAAAWVQDAAIADKTLVVGQPFGLEMRFGVSGHLHWAERTGTRVIASGNVSGAPGSTSVQIISTSAALPDQWVTISVSGIALPLQVWVRP